MAPTNKYIGKLNEENEDFFWCFYAFISLLMLNFFINNIFQIKKDRYT